MWMDFECGAPFIAEPPLPRQHFFQIDTDAPAVLFRSGTALKVPCLDGRSPTSGENSTSPVIESGASNFPFKAH